MTAQETDRLSRRYIRQSTWIVAALTLLTLLVAVPMHWETLLAAPLAVSAAFSLLASIILGNLWRRIATNSPEMLTTFYTAESAFRMLAALATLFCCFLAVGRDAMTPYVLVFMAFYLACLAHNAVYFARITNRQ